MPKTPVETAMVYLGLRVQPPGAVVPYAQMLEESGVVDYLWQWDVIAGWVPPHMWTPEQIPAAATLPDCYSWYDMRIQMGMAAAACDRLGLLGVMPTLRHGPAELMQSMMTLADATNGRAMFAMGVGEAYNSVAFGYKRSEGLARYEDHLRLYQQLWEHNEPFDFEGNIYRFSDASIGCVKGHKPKIYALGAGPRFLDLAARYADGWMTAVPFGFAHPELFAEKVAEVRRLVEQYGRDPDQFGIAIQAFPFLQEDPDRRRSTYANQAMKLFVATIGRFEQSNWALEGMEAAYPNNWNYSVHWVPTRVSREELDAVLAKVSPEMVEKCWTLAGSPKEVAGQLQGFVDAGATLVASFDYVSPFVLGADEAMESIGRTIEVCGLLKA